MVAWGIVVQDGHVNELNLHPAECGVLVFE